MNKIDFYFLGTGSAFSKKFGNNSCVVTIRNGEETTKRLLIDCGRTTPDDLAKSPYTWTDIDAIFITHLHGDHVYGLEEAGFFGRYVLQRKPHLIFPDKKMKNDLWEKVLKGTMVHGDLERNMHFEDYFTYEVVPSPEEYFIFNDTMVSVYSTQHVRHKKSFGLIFGDSDFVVYTSDSLFDGNFLESANSGGAIAIFHDCQFVDYEGKVHASINELESLSDQLKKKIFIMHYGDDLKSHYDRVTKDGMRFAIRNYTYSFEV